ncbi:hypothetical protein [uncultured Clostridium sp.]|uniref:hypothetical protein n=1 Tax=uncultured Clostridium sp. TaxID=59620 RepID=UPI0025F0C2AD|nr:hypothetical protein [uncultured Clostridium sp.]
MELSDDIPTLVRTDLENAFLNASDYSTFSGQTKTGSELGWVVFKHRESGIGIAFSKNASQYPIFINREPSGVWKFRGKK